MSQMSLNQARLIDPVLTQVAQGYKQPGLVGSALFPQVLTNLRSAQLVSFGREDFARYATRHVPGTAMGRIGFGYSAQKYLLEDHKIAGEVPLVTAQEAMNTPGAPIDLALIALSKAGRVLTNRLEFAQADLARNAAGYDVSHKLALTGVDQWTNAASDPAAVVNAAKAAVRASIGLLPNTMVIGPDVLLALQTHPKIVDRLKYTGRDIATVELLATLFGVSRVVVGNAVALDDATGGFADVWGKDVILAYTDMSGVPDQGSPTYGYTFNLSGYPLAEVPYVDRDRGVLVCPVAHAEAPYIVAPTAGFLIQNAVA